MWNDLCEKAKSRLKCRLKMDPIDDCWNIKDVKVDDLGSFITGWSKELYRRLSHQNCAFHSPTPQKKRSRKSANDLTGNFPNNYWLPPPLHTEVARLPSTTLGDRIYHDQIDNQTLRRPDGRPDGRPDRSRRPDWWPDFQTDHVRPNSALRLVHILLMCKYYRLE